MSKGWVKIHRSMFDNELWTAEPFTKAQAWIDLIGNANHSPQSIWIRGIEVKVDRGQIAWSEVTMAKRWKWSRGKVRRYLGMLKTKQMIEQQTGNETSVLTICNYRHFQDKDTPRDTADGTANETPSSTANGQQTEQQTVHKQECLEWENGENGKKNPLSPAKPDDPIDPNEIANLYNEILGDLLPSCKAMSKTRKANLRARVKEDAKRRDIAWWRRYFEYIADSPFLTGQIAGKDGKSFRADMGWILLPENLLKIIEGKYNQEG